MNVSRPNRACMMSILSGRRPAALIAITNGRRIFPYLRAFSRILFRIGVWSSMIRTSLDPVIPTGRWLAVPRLFGLTGMTETVIWHPSCSK